MKMSIAGFEFLLGVVLAGSAAGFTVVVSPNGSDTASGAEATPVASVSRAVERVREARKSGACTPSEKAKILLLPGEYFLGSPIELDATDSHLSFVAERPGSVILSGGKRIGPWKEANGRWRLQLPDGIIPEQLYVGGKRAQRAKSPNEFYYYMKAPVPYGKDPVTGKDDADLSRRAFIADTKDVAPLAGMSREDLSHVVMRVYHSWETSHARLQQVDPKNGLVVGTGAACWPYFYWRPYLQRYTLENFAAALDQSGEWFADWKTGELSYIPRAGEKMETAEAVIPVTEKFLRIIGTAESPAQDISFRGIRFLYAAYHLPANGQGSGQASVKEPATIDVANARGVRFLECEIAHTGAHAIWMRKNCRDSEITHCYVHDIGGGCIYLGDTAWTKEEEATGRITGNITVFNNILQSCGWVLPGSIGLWIGHAADVHATHNDISDTFYSGVSVGWTWGYAPTVAKRNILAFNHIHHIGKGVLNDMGAIYMLGDARGSAVTNNHIHDVWSYDYSGRGGWGLYTDEGSQGVIFENNLVHHVKTGCIHQHYGKENVFRNNIFACSMYGQIQRSRIEDHTTIIVTNNIIWWDNETAAVWNGGRGKHKISDMIFNHNLYWNPKGIAPDAFQGRSWEEWRREGQDADSQIVDPLFRNPEAGDFTFAPDSPALRAGFRPFDCTRAGVTGSEEWKRLATRMEQPPVKFAPIPPKLQSIPFQTDFEDIPVGNAPIGLTCQVERKGDAIRVTDKLARTGKRCLQIQDAEGLRFAFNPHFYLTGSITNGVLENSYSIRIEPGVTIFNEWRDYDGPTYLIAPSLHFRDGKVVARTANEKGAAAWNTLMPIAYNEWADISVRYWIDGPQAGKYQVSIKQGNNETKTFSLKVPLQNGKVPVVEWVGFGADSKQNASFYLDDFSLRPVR